MTRNAHGAKAYPLAKRHALAQYVLTGCLSDTFYATAGAQLATVMSLLDEVPDEFVAQLAVYARENGHMKDTPALLLGYLAFERPDLCAQIFDRVVDSGRMLRGFVAVLRSTEVGRSGLGSMPKRLVREWLAAQSDEALVRASAGQSPSLADVIRLAHPRPATDSRRALYGYLLGRPYEAAHLPESLRHLEAFRYCERRTLPELPFELLAGLELDREGWVRLAEVASWQATRMNLNTFARHGVFESKRMITMIANRLRDPQLVARARVLPYQLMVASRHARHLPAAITEALEDAMELAIENVPEVAGRVVVCPDVSGSMLTPITGAGKKPSAVRAVDVAALVAAAFLRRNRRTQILPFDTHVREVKTPRHRRVVQNAASLAAVAGGGTNISAPLERIVAEDQDVDLVVLVSDNESWFDAAPTDQHRTRAAEAWRQIRQRSPNARLVCLDLVPNRTSQVPEGSHVLNVGGFSDSVFEIIGAFARGESEGAAMVRAIEAVALTAAAA